MQISLKWINELVNIESINLDSLIEKLTLGGFEVEETLEIEIENQTITKASMGLGGVSATPVRAQQTQAFLVGKVWSLETLQQASICLQNEFQPITDMRASSEYRSHVLGTLLQRFWYEHQNQTISNLNQL